MVTMSTKRVVPAGRFKAQCLALLDRVEQTGEPLVVTRRGRPVAEVAPIRARKRTLKGSVVVRGDVVGALLEAWDVER
jgi:prevent-host-death family protein